MRYNMTVDQYIKRLVNKNYAIKHSQNKVQKNFTKPEEKDYTTLGQMNRRTSYK